METKKIQLEILERLKKEYPSTSCEVDQFIKDNNLKPSIECGKVYKDVNSSYMVYVNSYDNGFYEVWGFSSNNKWFKEESTLHPKGLTEATKQEWQSRLEQYAETLGYNHEEPNYKCLERPNKTYKGRVEEYYIDSDGFGVDFIEKYCSNVLMKNGVWAKTFENSDKDKIKELEERIKQLELTIKKK